MKIKKIKINIENEYILLTKKFNLNSISENELIRLVEIEDLINGEYN